MELVRRGHIRVGRTVKVTEEILDTGVYNHEQAEWVRENLRAVRAGCFSCTSNVNEQYFEQRCRFLV